MVLLKPYKDYYLGYKDGDKEVRGYVDLIEELRSNFEIGARIDGEQDQKDFIKLYGHILRMRNILTTFDEFEADDMLSQRDLQDYRLLMILRRINFKVIIRM